MVVETQHPSAGAVKGVGHPIKFHDLPRPEPKPAPEIGQHSREILREYGFLDGEIQQLIDEGVLIQP
jgi:formyl-CoA transferase